jgi:hypothetical protein
VGRDAGHKDLAARRANLAVNQLQQGGLARTAWADQKSQLTGLQGQVHVIEGAPGSINAGHCPEFDDWAHLSV